MYCIFILSLAKIIVFGGVATGSINAIEEDNVAVIINNKGLSPIATDTDAIIGSIICVVAVLDVSSVKKFIVSAVRRTIITGDK